MFDTLSDRLQDTFTRLRGHGRLSEAQVDAALREVRLALLEADVNFKVVKDFIARVRERSVGEEVTRSLTPAQQVVKIVHEELVVTLGERNVPLQWSPAAADGAADGRPPGLGQDHHRGQAGPLADQPRAASRCWSPATSSARRP